LSIPRTTIVVALGTSNSTPSRGATETGCEYPTCRFTSRPCSAARYPTPAIWSVFVNPSVTPVTAFWTRLRVKPCIALCSGVSDARSNTRLLSSCLTSTPRPTGTVNSPLGPVTFTLRSKISALTPLGTSTGAFPIRDILFLLVHEADDLAADALAPGLVVGEDPLRGREDRHPEPVEDAGDVLLLAVDAPPWAAHPPQARYPPLSVGAVLQLVHEHSLRPCTLLREVVYVALLLEDPGYLRLHGGVGDLDRVVLGHLRVADPGEEIRYGIVNRHRLLPTRFRYPGYLALVGQLPQADPAQPELTVVPVRAAAPLAPVVLPHRELLPSLLLYQQRFSGHSLPLNYP